MKDVLTIKFYTNEKDSDYHDIMLDYYPQLFEDLQNYFAVKNTRVFITYLDTYMGVLDATPFAEVEYTCELTKEDKDKCVDFLVKISGDWEYKRGGMREFSQLQLVKFAKISRDDVYIIKKSEIDLCQYVLKHVDD